MKLQVLSSTFWGSESISSENLIIVSSFIEVEEIFNVVFSLLPRGFFHIIFGVFLLVVCS